VHLIAAADVKEDERMSVVAIPRENKKKKAWSRYLRTRHCNLQYETTLKNKLVCFHKIFKISQLIKEEVIETQLLYE
jgi:hypothetical protein